MTIVVCVDANYGMLFNRRRQSSDSKLRERLCAMAEGTTLRMNPYSAKQFTDLPENAVISEDYLQQAENADVCFVEEPGFEPFLEKCERLVVYNWNRKYPADVRFPESCLRKWALLTENIFAGSSHDAITEFIYEKK